MNSNHDVKSKTSRSPPKKGFIVFVPNEIGMRSTYEALVGAGVREITSVDLGKIIDEKVFSSQKC